jgi:hypothetical protein
VQVPATGAEDAGPPTAEEIQGAKTLQALTNRSLNGLTFDHRADGTISVDLQGRFMHVLKVSTGPDGRLIVACHTDHALTSPEFILQPWRPVRSGHGIGRIDTTGLYAPLKVTISKPAALEVK